MALRARWREIVRNGGCGGWRAWSYRMIYGSFFLFFCFSVPLGNSIWIGVVASIFFGVLIGLLLSQHTSHAVEFLLIN